MRIFEGVPQNTKWTAVLEPASSALSVAVSFFLPLLMKNTGVSEMQIGLLSTITLFIGCAFQLIAPVIVNLLGRRKTLLIFSLLCWTAPLLLWSFAASFPIFLAAALFQTTAKITTIAHYCYLTEDVPNNCKARVFGFISLSSSFGGFFTCILAPFVGSQGIVAVAHILNFISCICMTAMFIFRYFITTETRVGMEILSKNSQMPHRLFHRLSPEGLKKMLKEPESCKLILIFILWSFASAMGFMLTIFLEDTILLSASIITMMPAITVIIGIILFFLYMHRRVVEKRVLAFAIAANSIAYIVLCISPAKSIWMVALFYILLNCGNYWYGISINPMLNNKMGESEKAETYSFIQLLVTLTSTPAGVITGALYQKNHYLPFIIMISLFILCGVIFISMLHIPNLKSLHNTKRQ